MNLLLTYSSLSINLLAYHLLCEEVPNFFSLLGNTTAILKVEASPWSWTCWQYLQAKIGLIWAICLENIYKNTQGNLLTSSKLQIRTYTAPPGVDTGPMYSKLTPQTPANCTTVFLCLLDFPSPPQHVLTVLSPKSRGHSSSLHAPLASEKN